MATDGYIVTVNTLTLLGAFFIGLVVGLVINSARQMINSAWGAPRRLGASAQKASENLKRAFKGEAVEEEIDRSSLSGFVAGLVADTLTFGLKRADRSFQKGLEAYNNRDYGAAYQHLSAAVQWDSKGELAPMHVTAHLRMGEIKEMRSDWRGALQHYQRVTQWDAENIEATIKQGALHFRLGETGPAISQLQRALELEPGNLETYYQLYSIYRLGGMEREAVEHLRLLKAGESPEVLAELFARHGTENFRFARYDEAINDYQLSLQFSREQVLPYLLLGDLYYYQEQKHTALEMWTRGYWAKPAPELEERLLRVLEEVNDRWLVMDALNDAIARNPAEGRYYLTLSKLYAARGETLQAEEFLTQAVRYAPLLTEAQLQMAEWYLERGFLELANSHYRAAVEAVRSGETVYRCSNCGYVTMTKQPRCFDCGEWDTLEAMRREEISTRALTPKRDVVDNNGANGQAVELPEEDGVIAQWLRELFKT